MDETDLKHGRLYPTISRIYEVSLAIAVAVVEKAYETGRLGEKAD